MEVFCWKHNGREHYLGVKIKGICPDRQTPPAKLHKTILQSLQFWISESSHRRLLSNAAAWYIANSPNKRKALWTLSLEHLIGTASLWFKIHRKDLVDFSEHSVSQWFSSRTIFESAEDAFHCIASITLDVNFHLFHLFAASSFLLHWHFFT